MHTRAIRLLFIRLCKHTGCVVSLFANWQSIPKWLGRMPNRLWPTMAERWVNQIAERLRLWFAFSTLNCITLPGDDSCLWSDFSSFACSSIFGVFWWLRTDCWVFVSNLIFVKNCLLIDQLQSCWKIRLEKCLGFHFTKTLLLYRKFSRQLILQMYYTAK